MKIKSFLAAAALILAINGQVNAQSATVTASGTVLSPISVTGTGLSFGNEIFPGINKVVAKTDANAAQFDITGEAGKTVTATLTLPTELTDGTNLVPVTFSTTDGGYATSDNQAGATAFDPSSTLTQALNVTGGTLFIWLGATAQPSTTQPAGNYSANIKLDVAYTGN